MLQPECVFRGTFVKFNVFIFKVPAILLLNKKYFVIHVFSVARETGQTVMCLCEADGNGITERKCKQGKETLEIRRPDMKETTRKARQSIQLLLLLLTFFTLNLVTFPMSADAAKGAS